MEMTTASASAIATAVTGNPFRVVIVWLFIAPLLPADGTLARLVVEPARGHLRGRCGSAAESLRSERESGSAGRVVRTIRKVELPLGRGKAPAGDLTGPGLPRGRIDVPHPGVARG